MVHMLLVSSSSPLSESVLCYGAVHLWLLYWTRPFSVIWHNSLYISLQSWFWCLIFKLADSKLRNACDVAFGEGGLGATQKRYYREAPPWSLTPYPLIYQFFFTERVHTRGLLGGPATYDLPPPPPHPPQALLLSESRHHVLDLNERTTALILRRSRTREDLRRTVLFSAQNYLVAVWIVRLICDWFLWR